MKKFFFLSVLLLCGLTVFTSCDKDDDEGDDTTPEYSIMIMQPSTDDKMAGDSIHIHVEFSEANSKTIHHAKVRIYNKADNTEIYSGPSEAHVHEESGAYGYHDDFILNVDAHTDWILEAKVWGHEAGAAEVVETIEFHVHPM